MIRAAGPPRSITLAKTVRGTLLLVVLLPLLAVGAMIWWLSDLAQMGVVFRGIHWGWFTAGILVPLLSFPLSAMRWRQLMRYAPEQRPRVLELSALWLIAHPFNLVVPGPGGDVVACYLLELRRGIGMANSIASAAYGHIFGLVLMVAIPVVAIPTLTIPFTPGLEQAIHAGLSIAALGIAVMLLLALSPRAVGRLSGIVIQRIPEAPRSQPGLLGRILTATVAFVTLLGEHSRRILGSPGNVALAFLYAVGVIIINVLCQYCLLRSAGVEAGLWLAAFLMSVHTLGHLPSVGVPGGGSVAAPVFLVGAMTTVLDIEASQAIGVYLATMAPPILLAFLGVALAAPRIEHVAAALRKGQPR